jgi:hypothetical protein
MLELLGLGVCAQVRRSFWSLVAESVVTNRTPRHISCVKRFTPELLAVIPAPFGARVRFAGLVGQDLRQWQAAAAKLASAIGVPMVFVTEPEPMVFELALRVLDPIGGRIDSPYVPIAQSWSLSLGLDESGAYRALPLSNVSGVVVGGLPGSGKSAWLTSALAAFGSSAAVQFVVIDGKGGQDLECLRRRSCCFINDDLDLTGVLAALQALTRLVRDRIRNGKRLFGSSNFWHRGPSAQVPSVFAVIDECQTFLDPRQLVTKEKKAIGAEIHAAVNYVVRKGRSAGVISILATQKPTSDSLPTDIRDNASLRVCFGVQSAYAAAAVLGDEWRGNDCASPLGAPTGIGVAAVDGRFCRFRAPYVSEAAVEAHMSWWSAFRSDPWKLLDQQLPGERTGSAWRQLVPDL